MQKSKEARAEYMRQYRRKHPDYAKREWTQAAIRILRRKGYIVIAPDDEEKVRDLMDSLFPRGNDENAIGKQILAEMLFRSKTDTEQLKVAEEIAASKGVKVMGYGFFTDKGVSDTCK